MAATASGRASGAGLLDINLSDFLTEHAFRLGFKEEEEKRRSAPPPPGKKSEEAKCIAMDRARFLKMSDTEIEAHADTEAEGAISRLCYNISTLLLAHRVSPAENLPLGDFLVRLL